MTADQLIRSYLKEEGKNSLHGYDDYREFFWSGVDDIQWEFATPQFIAIELNENYIIPQPPNCKKVLEVGFIWNEEFVPLQENKALSRIDTDACGNIIMLPEPTYGCWTDYNMHWRNGQNIGAYFGVGSKPVYGSYKKWPDGFIQISADYCFTHIVVKYLASMTDTDMSFEIPAELVEPLKAWIEYARIRRKRGVSESTIESKFSRYSRMKTVALRRKQGFTKAQAVQAIRSGFIQAPKI